MKYYYSLENISYFFVENYAALLGPPDFYKEDMAYLRRHAPSGFYWASIVLVPIQEPC